MWEPTTEEKKDLLKLNQEISSIRKDAFCAINAIFDEQLDTPELAVLSTFMFYNDKIKQRIMKHSEKWL